MTTVLLCLLLAAPAPELRADHLTGQWDYEWGTAFKGYLVLHPSGRFHEAEWRTPETMYTGTWAYRGGTLTLSYGSGSYWLEATRLRLAGGVLTGTYRRGRDVRMTKVYSYPRNP